jgi:hypothetical protein
MEVKDLHITVKEIFPIVLAVEIWGQTLSNHKVLFMTAAYPPYTPAESE